jgi:single-strand selective monofunctional uracil DNA glycosylase
VRFVYNPLSYARVPAEEYLRRRAAAPKKVLFLGMNPGPWGMAQTGVPFGEVTAVREWLGISGPVGRPPREHPRLPVRGFESPRSEVSGRRLWGLMAAHFGTPEHFFRDHFVANYCPLLFLDEAGRNLTPDKLPTADRTALTAVCDEFLSFLAGMLRPSWMIGVGSYAEGRIRDLADRENWQGVRIASIPHPSPANPRANKDWAGLAEGVLRKLGVW